MDRRALGIEYFVKALTTGERTAVERLEPHLAENVIYDTNSQPGVPPIEREAFEGRSAVRERLSGMWPSTPMYGRLGYSDPQPVDGDKLVVRTSGAVTITFSFNAAEEISLAYLDGGWGSGVAPPPPVTGQVEEIPLAIKGIINNARMNQTPMTVTYVDAEGAPHTSFRGSVCVISPTELGMWARSADGGLPNALAENPHMSLVYQDMRGTGILNVSGRGRISDDADTRRKVYELGPEVEQLHDLDRKGVAVVIEVTSLQGFVGGAGVSFQR